MEKTSKKKGMGAVIALAAVILVGVIVITVVIAGMIKDNGGLASKEDTSLYSRAEITTTEKTTLINWDETVAVSDNVQQDSNNGGGNANIQAGDVVTTPSTTKDSDKYDPIAEYEKLTKNGDNVLSDHHNNKYIKLVSEKFGVDKDVNLRHRLLLN